MLQYNALAWFILFQQALGKELNAGSSQCPDVPSPAEDLKVAGTLTTNQMMLIVAGAFSAASLAIAATAYGLHAVHYSNPQEQVKIMRIIAYIPIIALISWGSIWLNLNSWYLSPWLSFFEAFALANFFMLVCDLISPDPTEHSRAFDGITNRRGKFLGQAWFFRAKRATYQYTPIALLVAILTDVTFATDVYCITSSAPRHAKFWLNLLRLLSVNLAVTFLIAFTLRLRSRLANHKIMLKLIAFKAIVFVEGIQTFAFSIIIDHVTPTATLAWSDIAVGIPNLLLCVESFLASILIYYAFSYKPYIANRYGNPLHALFAPLNPTAAFKEFLIGLRRPDLTSLGQNDGVRLRDMDNTQSVYETVPQDMAKDDDRVQVQTEADDSSRELTSKAERDDGRNQRNHASIKPQVSTSRNE